MISPIINFVHSDIHVIQLYDTFLIATVTDVHVKAIFSVTHINLHTIDIAFLRY